MCHHPQGGLYLINGFMHEFSLLLYVHYIRNQPYKIYSKIQKNLENIFSIFTYALNTSVEILNFLSHPPPDI